ncbi:MAG: response regulator transcription factor [Sinobacteraceae bacterium]|nr:response regulator transcription factor [Nevskiaceae bacterium]
MRVLIVDDEPLSRDALAEIVGQRADIDAMQVVDHPRRALETLAAQQVDVLLLDIRMPELSGLQLLEAISEREGSKPAAILVTAFPEHAVEAFEKRALDYVLKPIVASRVHAALDAAARRTAEERAARLLEMLQASPQIASRSRRIAIKDKGRTVFTDVDELIAAEADGNYVMLQKTSGTLLLRCTIGTVAQLLMPYGFMRIHRSVIVNGAFVLSLEPGMGSEYVLRLTTGREYVVSKTYRRNLRILSQAWLGGDLRI